MAVKKEVKERSDEKKAEKLYSKEALLKCGEFKNKKDIISALLQGDKKYTKEQAEKAVSDFMKGGVR